MAEKPFTGHVADQPSGPIDQVHGDACEPHGAATGFGSSAQRLHHKTSRIVRRVRSRRRVGVMVAMGAVGIVVARTIYRELNRQIQRSKAEGARNHLQASTRKALAMKEANDSRTHYPRSATPREGMRPIPNEDIAPSGALNQEGPVLERSRKVR